MRLILVDDHELILEGLAQLVETIDGFEVVAKATNGKEALETIKRVLPDIVLMDVDMPVMNGMEATERIKKDYPKTKVLILTMHGEDSLVKRMMAIGADGFLLKNSDRKEFCEALAFVAKGEKYFKNLDRPTELKTANKNALSLGKNDDLVLLASLSSREMEIFKHLAQGLSNKEIGELLFISHRTVDTHRTNIMKKMHVHNVAGLVRIAMRSGVIGS